MSLRLCALVVTLTAFGCAKEPPLRDATALRYPSAPAAWPPAMYGAPLPPAGPLFAGAGVAEPEPAAATAPSRGATSPWWPVAARSIDTEVPGGDACLSAIERAGVKYSRIEEKKGVDTPIEIKSAIGAVRYDGGSGNPMVTDCRLALALSRVAPILRELHVSSLRFSGAYSYRMSRVGRLSLHAFGLALDVHEVVIDGRRLSVERDFARGLANGCAPDSPGLNRVACELGRTGMFQELLTPDYNFDHRNHLHLAIGRPASAQDAPPPPSPKAAPPRSAPPKAATPAPAPMLPKGTAPRPGAPDSDKSKAAPASGSLAKHQRGKTSERHAKAARRATGRKHPPKL